MKSSPSGAEINQHASVLMKRGIALLDGDQPSRPQESIGYFDEAITLRQSLPLDRDPLFRYGLAAGWINRGDALARLGHAQNLTEAVRSYDAALELLSGLPLDADLLYRRRLAIAWQNRGLALQAQDNASALAQARRSFEAAIAELRHENAAAIPDRNYLLAVARMNYAIALLRDDTADSLRLARTEAREAFELADRIQPCELKSAEVRLQARHVFCQALSKLLRDASFIGLRKSDLIGEATDVVEDGMDLARAWEARGVERFQPIAQDLFHFGARVYRIFQPHFVNEFLLEHLPGDVK